MIAVSSKQSDDLSRVNEISEKLMENPEVAGFRECPIVCVRGLGLQVVRESVGVSHG